MGPTQLLLAVCASQAAVTAGFAPSARRALALRPARSTVVGIEPPPYAEEISTADPLHVVIAGAGVGGLALANAFVGCPHVKVTVLEKTSKFKRFGGPIQLASNAMQVLKTMDEPMFSSIVDKATFTGNLKNGIKDGIRDEW